MSIFRYVLNWIIDHDLDLPIVNDVINKLANNRKGEVDNHSNKLLKVLYNAIVHRRLNRLTLPNYYSVL